MATLPSYVHVQLRGAGERPTPVVARSEMERGVAKQRRIAADPIVQVPAMLFFRSQADAVAFETWFYDNTTGAKGGAAWFDWTNPRTGLTQEVRIVDGDIGTLEPLSNAWAFAERPVTFEYVRSTL